MGLSLNLKIKIRANLLSLVAGTVNPLLVRGEVTELDTEVVFDQSTGLSATWQQGVSGEEVRPLGRVDLGTRPITIGPLVIWFTTELAFEVGGEWPADASATVGTQQTYRGHELRQQAEEEQRHLRVDDVAEQALAERLRGG